MKQNTLSNLYVVPQNLRWNETNHCIQAAEDSQNISDLI